MADRTTEIAAGAAGAVVAGGVAADQYYRARARRVLGKDFSPETFAKLDKIARQNVLNAHKGLDAGEAGALRRYTDYDNRVINRYLRTGEVTRIDGKKLVPVTDAADRAKLERSYKIAAENANKALNSSTLPQGTKLFRATGTTAIGRDKLKPGATFSDSGIQSTTRSMSQADAFYKDAAARGKKPVMMVIDAGGKKGMSVEAFSKFGYEREIAMPSNTTYKVDRVATGVKRHLFDKARDYAFVSVQQAATSAPAAVAEAGSKLAMPKAWMNPAAATPKSIGSKLGFAAAAAGIVAGAAYALTSRASAAPKPTDPKPGAYLDDGAKEKAQAAPSERSMPTAPRAADEPEKAGTGPIEVPGYTRADGVQVQAYTRQRVK